METLVLGWNLGNKTGSAKGTADSNSILHKPAGTAIDIAHSLEGLDGVSPLPYYSS
jgi:hypothetical protein